MKFWDIHAFTAAEVAAAGGFSDTAQVGVSPSTAVAALPLKPAEAGCSML
jgi:hypothetical protein